MKRYYRVKEGSKFYQCMDRHFNWWRDWYNEPVYSQLNEMLGCDINNNLVITNYFLGMSDVPENLKSQFNKKSRETANDDIYYRARDNSKIAKQYIQFCKDNNLYNYDSWLMLADVGLNGHSLCYVKKTYLPVKDTYYIITEVEVVHDDLEEKTEVNYCKERAELLENNEEVKL